MSGLEAGALKIGTAVARSTLTMWFNRRTARKQRSQSLVEVAAGTSARPLQKAQVEHLVTGIANQVATQLSPLLTHEYRQVPEAELRLVLDGVAAAVAGTDLTDDTILAIDIKPEVLFNRIRSDNAEATRAMGLSTEGLAVYDFALSQACRYLCSLITQLPAFQGRGLQETLARLSALTIDLAELLSRVPHTRMDAPQGEQHDAEFESEYLTEVRELHRWTELIGISVRERPRLPLSTAYLSLRSTEEHINVRKRASRKMGRRPRVIDVWDDFETMPHGVDDQIEKVVGSNSRVLVRGEAGSGKTTFLSWVAYNCAARGFERTMNEWNFKVPFVILLRNYASGVLPAPEDFLRATSPSLHALMPSAWVHRTLRSGRGALLIDGVDEVPTSRRKLVKEWLQGMLRTFPGMRVVITSRPSAADRRWLVADNFLCADLEPMGRTEVRTYISHWHDAARLAKIDYSGKEIEQAQLRIVRQLDSREHLQALATNPLLCSMLCALNLVTVTDLPQSRMELYRSALMMLLELRDAERDIPSLLPAADKTILLRDLAWRLTVNNKLELFKDHALQFIATKLESMPHVHLPAIEVLEHLLSRSGVVREPVPDRVDFIHRTFQEYLAASEATEQLHMGLLIDHAHLDQWRETVIMACGHGKRPQIVELINGILDRADREGRNARSLRLLATSCLETILDMDPEVGSRLDEVVRSKLVPPRSLREASSLSTVGKHILRFMPPDVSGLSEVAASASVKVVAMSGHPDAMDLLRSYAADPRPRVQEEVCSAWEYFDPEAFCDSVLASSSLVEGRIRIHTSARAALLNSLPQVKSVSFQPFELHVKHEVLSGIPNLVDVELNQACGECIESLLASKGSIETLSFNTGRLQVADYEKLIELNGLRELDIRGYEECPPGSFEFIGGLPRLRSVRFSGFTLSDSALTALNGCKNLVDLTIISGSAVTEISQLPDVELQRLWLSESPAARDIAALAHKYPGLEALYLDRSPCVDLQGVANLRKLRVLSLSVTKVDNLKELEGMNGLDVLYIDRTPVRDLKPLASLTGVTVYLSRGVAYSNMEYASRTCKVKYWA